MKHDFGPPLDTLRATQSCGSSLLWARARLFLLVLWILTLQLRSPWLLRHAQGRRHWARHLSTCFGCTIFGFLIVLSRHIEEASGTSCFWHDLRCRDWPWHRGASCYTESTQRQRLRGRPCSAWLRPLHRSNQNVSCLIWSHGMNMIELSLVTKVENKVPTCQCSKISCLHSSHWQKQALLFTNYIHGRSISPPVKESHSTTAFEVLLQSLWTLIGNGIC